jgi:uncharacterized Zn ribbon protein
MKRLLNYAADNGYDSIAITPGAEQAKRFSLSKQIDALEWDERTGRLYAKQKNGSDFNKMADGVTPENLSDYVGKEVADKLMSQPSTGTNRMLGGVDLEVGGEGMKGFYDQILPSYLNTFGKPYGAQVDSIVVPTTKSHWESIDGNTPLENGDTIVLTQGLNVKGANFMAPKGTVVRKIRLVPDNTDQIEGKVNEQTIVILTKFVRKSA